jgi:putative membrane protein
MTTPTQADARAGLEARPGASAGAVPRAEDPSVELSSRRTGMSFQRTRMSADRTLMSVIRTALSLIGFGFTIFQFFRYLRDSANAPLRTAAPRNFGVTLVALGIAILALGIWQHVGFMQSLRRERSSLVGERLVHGDEPFP